jgi:GNAT superfamily N-acetyltransferase
MPMCDDWMPAIELPLTPAQFRQLPRNPAYKYEYLKDRAYLSPRPKHYHALLDLAGLSAEEEVLENRVSIRPLAQQDWPGLECPFRAALSRAQPFAGLSDIKLEDATRTCLQRTRTGQDGPLLPDASFVAADRDVEELVGGILITGLPGGDPSDWDSYYWSGPAPAGAAEASLVQAHLTWIFVSPPRAGHGIGSALLAASVRALKAQGYASLWSTFMHGNDMSLLWHWRNGFRLLPYPGSHRRMLRLFRERTGNG